MPADAGELEEGIGFDHLDVDPHAEIAMQRVAEIVGQFSALLQQISVAALDHSISKKEAKEIRECWDKLKSYAEGFVRCCEEGDYDQMMQIPKPSEGPARYLAGKA